MSMPEIKRERLSSGSVAMEPLELSHAHPPDYYSIRHPVNQFYATQSMRGCIDLLNREGLMPLSGRRILDVGCRGGNWMIEYVKWGAEPSMLAGIDIDAEPVENAKRRLPAADLYAGNAASLPWKDAQFDLVSQFVVFSSVLDAEIRRRIAAEMLRVTKPGGRILWYDFSFNNPRNPRVRGVKKQEILNLFPGCRVELHRATLAPPITRALVKLSWIGCLALEKLPFLCTHYLGIIRKPL